MRIPTQLAIFLYVIFFIAPAFAKSDSDTCHVYVVDVKAALTFREKTDLDTLINKSKEEQEKIMEEAGLGKTFDVFLTKAGEEELTTKTYPFPKSKLIITASVFYTDESLMSTEHQDSMLIGIVAAGKAFDNALEAPDAAIAEVTYDENTDAVRVKKNIVANGRLYLVGLECRCKSATPKEKQ